MKLSISPAGASPVVDESEETQESTAVVVVVDDESDGAPKKATLPPEAKLEDDGTVTLTLSKPVTLTVKKGSGKTSEEVYGTLTFHELTGLDRRLVTQAPAEQQEVLFVARAAKISAVRMNAIWDLLPMRDIKRIEKVITFLAE